MRLAILKLITLLHIIFILFMLLSPLMDSNYFLLLHAICVPFMVLHWICNDNTCILTVIEKKLRKEVYGMTSDEDCITCRMIEPVYDFKNNHKLHSRIIYIITFILWIISAGKLYCKWKRGDIRDVRGLLEI